MKSYILCILYAMKTYYLCGFMFRFKPIVNLESIGQGYIYSITMKLAVIKYVI